MLNVMQTREGSAAPLDREDKEMDPAIDRKGETETLSTA